MPDILLLFTTPAGDWWLNGDDPSLVMLGDSWAKGQGVGGSGIYTNLTNVQGQPAHWIRQDLGTSFVYHLYATGGHNLAEILADHAQDAADSNAKAVVLFGGGNDVFEGRTWAQVEADLDSIAALLQPDQHLFLAGIPPARGFGDAVHNTARGWEATQFPAWCVANDATFFEIRTAMGQIRPSTGQLDDLHDDYYDGADGNHPEVPVGTQALAARILEVLEEYYT